MADHIIHRQKLILKLSKNKDIFSLQNRLSNLLQEQLPDALEQLFNRYAPSGQTIRLHTLQLDLGTMREKDLEPVFKSRLLEKLEEAISERKEREETAKESLLLSEEQALREALLAFLRTGRLPWYKTAKDLQRWEQEMMEAFSAKDWRNLQQWLKTDAQDVCVQRFIYQFSDVFLLQFVANATDGAIDAWTQLYKDSLRLRRQSSLLNTVENRYATWDCLLQIVLTAIDVESGSAQASGNLLRQQLKEVLWQEIASDRNQSLTEQEKQHAEKGETQVGEEDEFFVCNSGLVLLHPFLEMFFAELGLLTGQNFANDSAHSRAVLLMHYLATGETEVSEFDLPLQKLLCGFPLEETLPNRFEISEKERREAENLLRSVNGYWPPLKKTSVAGLRKTFLQRNGKLQRVETGWRLTVAQKTVDVLLGKLPWGFSTIRLPWMETMLGVEWY